MTCLALAGKWVGLRPIAAPVAAIASSDKRLARPSAPRPMPQRARNWRREQRTSWGRIRLLHRQSFISLDLLISNSDADSDGTEARKVTWISAEASRFCPDAFFTRQTREGREISAEAQAFSGHFACFAGRSDIIQKFLVAGTKCGRDGWVHPEVVSAAWGAGFSLPHDWNSKRSR